MCERHSGVEVLDVVCRRESQGSPDLVGPVLGVRPVTVGLVGTPPRQETYLRVGVVETGGECSTVLVGRTVDTVGFYSSLTRRRDVRFTGDPSGVYTDHRVGAAPVPRGRLLEVLVPVLSRRGRGVGVRRPGGDWKRSRPIMCPTPRWSPSVYSSRRRDRHNPNDACHGHPKSSSGKSRLVSPSTSTSPHWS